MCVVESRQRACGAEAGKLGRATQELQRSCGPAPVFVDGADVRVQQRDEGQGVQLRRDRQCTLEAAERLGVLLVLLEVDAEIGERCRAPHAIAAGRVQLVRASQVVTGRGGVVEQAVDVPDGRVCLGQQIVRRIGLGDLCGGVKHAQGPRVVPCLFAAEPERDAERDPLNASGPVRAHHGALQLGRHIAVVPRRDRKRSLRLRERDAEMRVARRSRRPARSPRAPRRTSQPSGGIRRSGSAPSPRRAGSSARARRLSFAVNKLLRHEG